MLSEITTVKSGSITITLDKERAINCVGIGNTDGTTFIINGQAVNFKGNGLYVFDGITAQTLSIETNATYIGRLAAGLACTIPTSIAKEPGYNSTANPRITLSGQVIAGLGGYNYRTLGLDSRYKIDQFIMNEINEGYKYIALGYPFFIDLSDESYKLPFDKLYANDKNQQQFRFESGVRKYLYSRRFDFEERF